MATRLQFEANLIGEIALVFDDQNRGARRRVDGGFSLSEGGMVMALFPNACRREIYLPVKMAP